MFVYFYLNTFYHIINFTFYLFIDSSLNESEDELSSRGFGLHSSRRPKKQLETADSISSDEDDDNFEILTAENLFSTLLSRV